MLDLTASATRRFWSTQRRWLRATSQDTQLAADAGSEGGVFHQGHSCDEDADDDSPGDGAAKPDGAKPEAAKPELDLQDRRGPEAKVVRRFFGALSLQAPTLLQAFTCFADPRWMKLGCPTSRRLCFLPLGWVSTGSMCFLFFITYVLVSL